MPEPPAAGDPVLHLHGRDPGAVRPRRGSARRHRPAVRPDARRARLCGDPGRRAARRDHRHGRRLGHRHGDDLAAGDVALRLRSAHRHRRHRRLRHHHPDHPAIAGADRARRPLGQLGRRHVRRRDRSRASCRSGCSAPGSSSVSIIWPEKVPALPPEVRTLRGGRCSAQCCVAHGAVAGADLPRARHHLPRPRDADRGGAMGAVGALAARDRCNAGSPGTCSAGDGHHAHSPRW